MGKGKKSSLLLNLLVMVVSLFVCLFITELGFRLFWHNPYAGEKSQHVLELRRHHPNYNLIADRSSIFPDVPTVLFRTDDRSYIIPSKRFDRPDKTIAFFGGSTTECLGVQEELRFHHLVSKNLEERGVKVNSLNIGHYGNMVHDALNLLLNHVILDKPDIAVLMHACNDAGMLRAYPNYGSRMGFNVDITALRKWFIQILSSHSAFIGFFRTWYDHGVVVTTFDEEQDTLHNTAIKRWADRTGFQQIDEARCMEYRSRLESFIDICRNFNITPVLMTQPAVSFVAITTPPWHEASSQRQFNEIVREVAVDRGVVLVDLEAYIQADIEKYSVPLAYFFDQIHVADEGSKVYAQVITETLWDDIFSQEFPDSLPTSNPE